MKHNLVPLTSRVRLLFLTTLVVVLGFAFASQFSDNSPYNDGTARIVEMQEFSGDSEPPPLNDTLTDAVLSEILFVCAKNLVVSVVFPTEVLPRLTFLYHIRPRSPPAQSSI
jgi:hypothetical protein